MEVFNVMNKYRSVSEMLDNENLRENLDIYIKENYELKQRINFLEQELEKLQKHNARGAGRKSKINDYEKNNIFELWVSGDFTIKELAEKFNCSTRTVDRILKERKEKRMEDLKLFVNEHMRTFENWQEGKVIEVWHDENNILCIKYESGKWWHYRLNDKNEVEWW